MQYHQKIAGNVTKNYSSGKCPLLYCPYASDSVNETGKVFSPVPRFYPIRYNYRVTDNVAFENHLSSVSVKTFLEKSL